MIKQIFLFIFYLTSVDSWTNFSQFPKVRKCGYLSMGMPHFELGREYVEFYNKYKFIEKERNLVIKDQDEFVRENLQSYKIFEKNYYIINEANKFLETQNKSFSLSLNH